MHKRVGQTRIGPDNNRDNRAFSASQISAHLPIIKAATKHRPIVEKPQVVP